MPKITINKDKCKSCLLCISFCPKNVIGLSDKLNKRGVRSAVYIGEKSGCFPTSHPEEQSDEGSHDEILQPFGLQDDHSGNTKKNSPSGHIGKGCIGCIQCAIICPDVCIEVYK